MMDFSDILRRMKAGKSATREGWGSAFVFLTTAEEVSNRYIQLEAVLPKAAPVGVRQHFLRREKDGTIGPYLPDSEALLATDWSIVYDTGDD